MGPIRCVLFCILIYVLDQIDVKYIYDILFVGLSYQQLSRFT